MKSKITKFIATVKEDYVKDVDKIAEDLSNDGVHIDKVSKLFGIISGNSQSSLEELKSKYEPKGISFEHDREVKI
jgi:hypothetical protein